MSRCKTKPKLENTMTTKLVIVADLGLLRGYRETQNAADRQSHLELIEELKPEIAHQKLSDQLTDQAGRFPTRRWGWEHLR